MSKKLFTRAQAVGIALEMISLRCRAFPADGKLFDDLIAAASGKTWLNAGNAVEDVLEAHKVPPFTVKLGSQGTKCRARKTS